MMRYATAALCALLALAGCATPTADDDSEPDALAHRSLSWQELGDLVFDDEHEHNIREAHSEVARGLRVLDHDTFGPDGRSLGEYTELDNEGGLVAVAVVTGPGYDLRIVLLDRAALPELVVVGQFDEPEAYGDVKLDEELPLAYVPYPGPRTAATPSALGARAFSIWDVSDPARPVRVGEAPGAGCHMLNTIRIQGASHVWCASVTGPTGFRVVALPTGGYTAVPIDSAIPQSDPETVRYATYYSSLTAAWPVLLLAPHDMTAQYDPLTGDPLLVVAHELHGIRVFDISEPLTPIELASWRGASAEDDIDRVHTALVAKVGERRIAFGATETLFGVEPELYIVDMTDYAEPQYLGTWTPPGVPHDGGLAYSLHNFQVVGDRLYIANFHAGLWVLDLTDPSDPAPIALRTPVRSCDYPRPDENVLGHPIDANQFWDPVVVDGYVLASDMACGVEVLHVDGDPAGDPAYTSFA